MLPQVGHVGPTLEIAATLISRGHRAVYLAGEEFQIPTGRVGAELFHPTEITASLGAKDLEVVHPYNRSDSDLSTRSILVAFEKVQPDLFSRRQDNSAQAGSKLSSHCQETDPFNVSSGLAKTTSHS